MIGIYIRVSTVTQAKDGYSLSAQKDRLEAFCKAQGWKEYKLYIEEGLSAKNDKRPIYQELLEHVRQGKVKTVLVYKLDRIMRSLGELDNMLKTLEKHDCAFKSATEPFDTDNATGKLFIYLVGAFAQWEIELSSERIKMALEEKVSKGERVGGIPYPFDLDENEILIPNKERAQTTLKMIELLRSGYSSPRIADYLSKTNTDKDRWHHNAVIRILRNPALCGHTRWNDDVYKGTHEGIISEKEFDAIQTILDDRANTRHREVKSTYLFQGKLACPSCGNALNVNRYFRKRKDGTKYQGAMYRCPPCAKDRTFYRTVNENRILKSLYTYMRSPKIIHDDLRAKESKPSYRNELEEIERKRQKYQRAWANDLMTDDEFKKMMDETRGIYEELKSKEKDNKTSHQIDPEEIKNTITNFNEHFNELTNDEKRIFISTFLRKIHFKVIPQPPLRAGRHKKGRPKIKVTDVEFH